MSESPIYLYQLRSLSEIAGAALRYAATHFKSLFSFLAGLVFFLYLVTFLGAVWLGDDISAVTSLSTIQAHVSEENLLQLIALFIVYHCAGIFQNSIVSRHLLETARLQGAAPPEDTFMTENLKDDFINTAFNYVLFSLGIGALKFVSMFLAAYLGLVYNGVFMLSGNSMYENYMATAILLVPLLVLTPVVLYFYTTALFVGMRDKLGALQSIKKVWYYFAKNLRVNWQASTAFLSGYFVILLAALMLVYVIPRYIIVFSPGNPSENSFRFLSIVVLLISRIMMVFYQVAVLLHFGNLEERQEGRSLKQRIEQH